MRFMSKATALGARTGERTRPLKEVDSGNYPSIALSSNGKAHICYYQEGRGLRYATNKSGSWELTTVDWGKKTGSYCSIVLDSDDYVHISYYDGDSKHLKYATNRPPE